MVTPDTSNFATMAKTIGAVALGVVLGIIYIKMYPSDKPELKMFVALILLLETLHTALWLIAGYHYLIEQPFVTVASLNGHWSVRVRRGFHRTMAPDSSLTWTRPIQLTVLITLLCVQDLHHGPALEADGNPRGTDRIWAPHRPSSFLLPNVRMISSQNSRSLLNLSVSVLGFAIAAGVEAYEQGVRLSAPQRAYLLADVDIPADQARPSLVAGRDGIRRDRSDGRHPCGVTRHRVPSLSDRFKEVTPFKVLMCTKRLRLTRAWSISRCIDEYMQYACVSAIILPGNLIYAGVSIVGTKLYANSVLAVLNSRQYINERWMDDFDSIHLPELTRDSTGLNAQPSTMSWVPATVSTNRDALVYVNATVKEALRWHNVVPLGVTHSTLEDDELHGYFIPAGTAVVPNVWAILHDPRYYPDPTSFNPDRFIRDGRVCPGRHFADSSLFLTIACVLHVFDIGPPLDENGCPVKVEYESTHGFLAYPEDCRCTIKPRSANHDALIRRSAEVQASELI
ncbi:hypothetical protein NUW54_g1983 [Trametes sanguinea]|uniref:Uncharacterized protein n=1 Tax=Trametes sanguinea TaxID=158606 RepID=A0ACC1Q6H4_9APHY|nr:hypothetical protein NUW54_g1983 [Trametes sanguinea]